jgi:hypothetical protein
MHGAVSERRTHVAVAAAFALIGIIQTWPLVTHLAIALPNDAGDPILNTWILWWNAHALPLTTRWWNGPMFYPAPGALTFSENLLGLSLFASPLQWIGASPIAAYNLLFLVSSPLSAFCAYLLARSLTRRTGPSIVAGVIYGYAIFRVAHGPHIQVQWTWWMPLALLGLHRWLAASPDRTARHRLSGLALFAIAWLGQSLSNGYYFFYLSVLIAAWIAWFARWRQPRRTLLPPLVAWAVAGVLIAPVMLTYRQVHGQYQFARTMSEIESGGADLTEFFRPSSIPRVFGVARQARGEHEVSLPLIGLAALGIALIGGARGGLLRRRRRTPHDDITREHDADSDRADRADNSDHVGIANVVNVATLAHDADRADSPASAASVGRGGGVVAARRERIVSTLQIALWAVAIVFALIALSTRVLGNWHFSGLGVHVSGMAKMLGLTWPAAILALALSPAIEKAWRARSVSAFYLVATCLTLVLAMGPSPRAWGVKFWNEAPYLWLMRIVPGLDGVRVPARVTLVTVLCLAILTALLLARVHLASVMRERLLFGVVIALSLLETWPGAMPMATLPELAPEVRPSATVIELPFGVDQELPALYRSMVHQRPLVNGYSGFFPLSHLALRECLARRDPECLLTLQRIVGPLDIVIERSHDPAAVWQDYASRLPNVEPGARTPQFAVYHLPAASTAPVAAGALAAPGRGLMPARINAWTATINQHLVPLALDGDWGTAWSTGRGQAANDALTLDMDPAMLAGVELWIGASFRFNYPRGLLIETSADGARWEPAWEGTTTQALFETTLASGQPGTRLTFAPRPARFLRLTATLNESAHAWSIAELAVLRVP